MADLDLLIVGGGPAGLSCAMTACKRGLRCRVVCAPNAAGWLQRADRIDNYPGMPAVSGRELLRVFEEQAVALGAEVVQGQVRQLQRMGKEYMALIGSDIVTTRAVALAMGAARPRLLPGEEELLGQGVSWCGTCDGMFYRKKRVAVISWWKGGAEDADFLAGICSGVDYYTMLPHEMPTHDGISFIDAKPKSLTRTEQGIGLTTDKGTASYDGVFIFRPAVAPDQLLNGLDMDIPFIRVDRRMATNLPFVYACGDCTGAPLQIAKAVGEGNIAAVSAAEDLAK